MSTRKVESFLLRIVVSEDLPPIPEHWRGRIQHIASGAEQQVDELAQIVAFIATHLHTVSAAELEIVEAAAPTSSLHGS